jgi:hypothetical protein
MAALLTQLAITHICHALTAQEYLVAKLQADLEPLKEAETLALLIEVEPATGLSLDECTHKLQAAQTHLRHLQGKLNTAIYYWHLKGHHKPLGQPWLRLRPAHPHPVVDAAPPAAANLKTNPSVSTAARYTQEMTGPTINPRHIPYKLPAPPPRTNVRAWRKNAWWRDRNHTKMVSVPRSGRLVPHCPQRYARRGYLAPRDRFVDEIGRQNARGPNIGYRLRADERPDPDCDPQFWEKELWGKGDIFATRAGLFGRDEARVDEEELSPRQVGVGFAVFLEASQYMPGTATSVGEYSTDSSWSSGSSYEMIGGAVHYGEEEEEEEWESRGGPSSANDGVRRASSFEIW